MTFATAPFPPPPAASTDLAVSAHAAVHSASAAVAPPPTPTPLAVAAASSDPAGSAHASVHSASAAVAPPLTSAERSAVIDAIQRANLWGSITIQEWVEHFGVPNAEEPWGPNLWPGMHHFVERYLAQYAKAWYLEEALSTAEYGWFRAPAAFSRARASQPVTGDGWDGGAFPCLYYWDRYYQQYRCLCVHILIRLIRGWLAHASRLTHWDW